MIECLENKGVFVPNINRIRCLHDLCIFIVPYCTILSRGYVKFLEQGRKNLKSELKSRTSCRERDLLFIKEKIICFLEKAVFLLSTVKK